MEIYGVTRDQIQIAAANANVHAEWQGYTKGTVRLAYGAKRKGNDESGGKYPGHIVRLRNEPDNVSGAKGKKAWASHSGRLSRTTGRYLGKAGVCWHGHYKFMLEVFKMNGNARIRTRPMLSREDNLGVPPHVYDKAGHITYTGFSEFVNYAHETGLITVQPGWGGRKILMMRDMCYCELDAAGNDDDRVYLDLVDEGQRAWHDWAHDLLTG